MLTSAATHCHTNVINAENDDQCRITILSRGEYTKNLPCVGGVCVNATNFFAKCTENPFIQWTRFYKIKIFTTTFNVVFSPFLNLYDFTPRCWRSIVQWQLLQHVLSAQMSTRCSQVRLFFSLVLAKVRKCLLLWHEYARVHAGYALHRCKQHTGFINLHSKLLTA
jgi:hypothetical protein